MACPDCQRRSALIAALTPAISRLSFKRQGLLNLLAFENEELLRSAKVKDPRGFLRGLEMPPLTESVPTALCRHDPDYPEALAQLPSAPAVLYATCTTERLRELLSKPTVAIGGSRDQTAYAERRTFELARDLARAGVTVVSGMNAGLERIAHNGALHTGGHTLSVMACSADRCRDYHEHLHRRIIGRGAAISEFPPGFYPREGWGWRFIASQRIIASLGSVVVVVEAGGRSCPLFTAEIAADLGHDIAVVPGRLTDPGGKLRVELLRDGVRPVGCAQDVLELMYDGRDVRAVAA
jgi:DNA processing protein